MNDSTSRRSFLQAAGFGAAALGLRGLPAWAFQEDNKHHFTIETTTLIVEAEMVQKRGGWVLDQQFMDQMSSPLPRHPERQMETHLRERRTMGTPRYADGSDRTEQHDSRTS